MDVGRLSIELSGGFTVTLDGAPVAAFDFNKVRALLAYLEVEAGGAARSRPWRP